MVKGGVFPGIRPEGAANFMSRACVVRSWPRLAFHWIDRDVIWASDKGALLSSADGGSTWQKVAPLPRGIASRLLCKMSAAHRLFRLGIRSYIQLDAQSCLIFLEGSIFVISYGTLRYLGKVRYGNGPLPVGSCKDERGRCFYGEYWANRERAEVRIYVWQQSWENWRVFYRFPRGSIRHVHGVHWDPYEECIWVTTGDRPGESLIGKFSEVGGAAELSLIASGRYGARALSLVFAPDFVYWGSDAGRDSREPTNAMYRWNRRTKMIEEGTLIPGPIYYMTKDSRGRFFAVSAVEGSCSERDRNVRLWMSVDGRCWEAVYYARKDCYPMLFGYGVFGFPKTAAPTDHLYATAHSVKNMSGTVELDVVL